MEKFKHLLIPILLFLGTFLVYKNIYPNPRNWYDHYLHLSQSILEGKVDVPNLPDYYQDKVVINGKTFLPFPPGASLALIPFLEVSKNITQQQVSIITGALCISLFYILLKKFTRPKNAILISLFIAFGTSFFWSAVVGTTWFFAHIVSIFFLLMSLNLIFYSKNKILYFIAGVFFALSSLTRFPVLASGLFFVYLLRKEKVLLAYFLSGAFLFIPATLFYNYLRFGNILNSGYTKVYESYVNGGLIYSLQRLWFPNSKPFNYFDLRAIPYHLYTFFVMPPEGFKPNPYGMGIIFTSPLLLVPLVPPFKKNLEKAALWGIVPTAVLVFMHYAQGWVQFGYRFVLDFIVYLSMILATRFKINKINILLFVISVVVNFWGVKWAIELGW